jgi:hypothetical protein
MENYDLVATTIDECIDEGYGVFDKLQAYYHSGLEYSCCQGDYEGLL